MKKIIVGYFLVVLAFGSINTANAQVPTDLLSAKTMLAGKGITEQELKDNLAGKGIDIDNISPADLPSLQGTIEQAVAEIEAEKGQKTGNGVVEDLTVNNELSKENLEDKFEELDDVSATEVGVRLETGASIEEAISDIKADHTNIEKESPIYGHSIFFNNTLDFYRTTQTSSTPDHYILDVGDKITINIFGQSQADLIYQIENDGFIRPSGMYKIYLKGLPINKAKELLYSRFQTAYSFNRGQFNVDLNTARTISVSIYGEVNHPGTYTMSAFNNAMNALIAAGGPTSGGSVREIKVITEGKEKMIDVYSFLSSPQNANDFGLRNNSVIYVPPRLNVVTLSGPVLRQGMFELKEQETLSDLIRIAGGFQKGVVLENYNLVRTVGLEQSLKTFGYDETENLKLEDLDKISFKFSNEPYENYVRINGTVKFPGDYSLKPNMTLGDLLDQSKLEPYTRLDIAFLTRKKIDGTYKLLSFNLETDADSLVLENEDELIVLDQRTFTQNHYFSVSGAVKSAVNNHVLDKDQTLRLSDAILMAGGLQNNASDFAILTIKDIANSLKVKYKIVNIKKAVTMPLSVSDLSIEYSTTIFIPTIEAFGESNSISISGAVRRPTSLVYDSAITLRQILLMANGLKPNANNFAFVFGNTKKNSKERNYETISLKNVLREDFEFMDVALQPGDQIYIPSIEEYSDQFNISIQGSVRKPGQYVFDSTLNLKEVILMAGGLKLEAATNKVDVFRLQLNGNEATQTLYTTFEINRELNPFTLEDKIEIRPYDVIVVRAIPDFEPIRMVTLTGEVKYPGVYGITIGKETISDVIKKAGGLTKEAYLGNASMKRASDNIGFVAIDFKKALRKNKTHDLVLISGDEISIGKESEVVLISLRGTNAEEFLIDEMTATGKVAVPYNKGKRAGYYVRNYVGGFDKDAKVSKTFVQYKNGRLKKTINLGIFRIQRKVVKGAEIKVSLKPIKEKKDKKKDKEERPKSDQSLKDTVVEVMALVISAFTVLVLANQLK